jgi:hypothetical protein
MEDEEPFGLWQGQCQACETWGPVNDLMLCEECAAMSRLRGTMLERDLIRQRDWEYSATAFGLSPEACEELRRQVVRQFGEALELIAPPTKPRAGGTKPRRKRSK